MYIDPEHWRRGIGRLLWARAEEHLMRSGVHEVTLWVLKENARALAFYRAIGFTADVGYEKSLERGGAKLLEVRLRSRIVG